MLEELWISLDEEEIEVEIIRSKRRSMAIQIRTDGSVVARAPMHASDRAVKRFVSAHARWIADNRQEMFERRKKLADNPYDIPAWESLSAADKKIAKQKIMEHVDYYANRMEIDYGSISMRNQKSRWGSCSSKGNLNFNYRLAYLPEELLDYVVVHELAHRRHMDHSAAFWEEVETYYPAYRKCRQMLNDILLA